MNHRITNEDWHLLQNRTLMGYFHGSARTRVEFPWILDLYRQEKIKLNKLISRHQPVDEINEAFNDLKQGKVARTVVVFE